MRSLHGAGLWLLVALLGGTATAQARFAVRCGTLHVGDGQVLADAFLVVRDGKIESVGKAAPEGVSVLDAGDKVVMPGIVAADTDLAGAKDADYTVTPDFVALEGFDLTKERTRPLSGGVTTVYLAPGRRRLIPGQGSVVKLHGEGIVDRVLSEACCLRITMGSAGTGAPALFEPNPAPTADDPLVPARKQYPSAVISQVTELRRVFREAQVVEASLHGQGAVEDRYEASALIRVLQGELPLRVAAREAADIRRALQFAGAMGARLTLEDPYEVEQVAGLVSRAGAAATFRIPVRPGKSNPGGENRLDEGPVATPEAPARAAAAGVTIAIAPADDADLADYLLVAGIAIRAGLSPADAMIAITSGAARVLGVQDRVGALRVGLDADFLVLSGDPFSTGTMVEKAFVGGELAFERETSADLLAVRAAKILTAEGPAIRDGVLLVENGRIKAVGQDLAIPYGAKVIDTDGVVVPGFIDAYCHLGLGGSGTTEIPTGAADQQVAAAVDVGDAQLREAVRAGITTALISGKDSGAVSGRVAAIKTGAATREAMVLKETAAIRMVHDAIGPDALDPLDTVIERGRKYIEAWARYEKALAEGKEVPVVPVVPAGEQEDPISGVWEGDIANERFPIGLNLSLRLSGTTVTGQVTMVFRGQERPPNDIESGTFSGGKLNLTFSIGFGGAITIEATVADDEMTGTARSEGFLSGDFTATRVSKDASAPAGGATSGALRKPTVDESLEPIRALIEGKIPAIIRCGKEPAIADIAAWAKEEKLAVVLHGADDAAEAPAILGDERPGVMLEPDVIQREDGELINRAKVLAEAGVPVALVSGATSGSRYLPVHAAYAVRYGLDPAAALAAVTINPARMLGLDGRVGSLAKGKDADFVIFSGEPFELTSRVLVVVAEGRIVADERGGR